MENLGIIKHALALHAVTNSGKAPSAPKPYHTFYLPMLLVQFPTI
jgi:hypothetical protein